MRFTPMVRAVLVVVAAVTLLGVIRYKPWQALRSGPPESAARQSLAVGFLPVT
jgi:hypothetical protein